MKKIMKPLAGFLFAIFLIGVFGLVISLTYSALGRIFPDSFINQILGLVLFDIAALVWGLAFVYKSESTSQYALAAIGFLVGLAGTFVMVAAEVSLSSSQTGAVDWAKALNYAFIGCGIIHLSLGYAHKATAPDVDAQIRLGAAQAEITQEAIKQAELELEQRRAAMANIIRPRLVADIKRNLNLPISDDELDYLQIIDAEPEETEPGKLDKIKGVPVELWTAMTNALKKKEQTKDDAEVPEQTDSSPFPENEHHAQG